MIFLEGITRNVISLCLHLVPTELGVVTNVRDNNYLFPCDFCATRKVYKKYKESYCHMIKLQ